MNTRNIYTAEFKFKNDITNKLTIEFASMYQPNAIGWRKALLNELKNKYVFKGEYKDLINQVPSIHVIWKSEIATYNLTIYPKRD